MQFSKLYADFAAAGLEPAEQITMAHLYDRMELSKQNNGFYDNKEHAYYITFSRDELSDLLNVSVGTITRVFKSLRKKGWIITKQRFNASNRIFLPKSLECKNETSKVQKSNSNQTEPNQPKREQYDKHDTNKDVDDLKLDGIANSIINKAGFSPRVASMLKTLSFNKPDKLHYYVKLILKSKRTALRYSVPKSSELRQFETNPLLNDKLEQSLEPIIRNANRKAKNSYGYMLKSFRNLFEEAIDERSQQLHHNDNIDDFLPGNLAY